MTYPDVTTGLTSVGMFLEEGRDADKKRERLVAIGMQWFDKCQSQRQRVERQWYLNLAFYGGNQYVQFRQASPNGSFDLYVPKAPYYRVRMIINQTRRIIRKEISRLVAQKPNAFVVPASNEDADVFASQAGEQIWDSLWRRKKFNRILRETVFWQAVCGNGFVKSYWDASAIDPENPNVTGDICIDVVNPFHLFVPDMMETEIENQPYIIHAQVRNNQWIRTNFGIEPSNNSGGRVQNVDDSLLAAVGVERQESKKEQSIVLEIWVKPGYLPEMPNGGMFTIAAGQLVQGLDEWPYEHGQYPIAKFDSIPTGKFYTSSIVEDLIPLQRELNRSRSQLIEAKNKMSKPQLLAEKGSVDAKKITTEPGQVIEYAVGHNPPSALPLQNIPSYVTEEINRLYTDMSDISGQHEVSNGSTPPGVTAATAISFLQEQDESLIAPHYTSIEEGIEKVAGQCLTYVKMYWDEERTVKLVGLEGTFDVQTFKSTDLRGNADIRVESGSALPTSKAAKQAFIMDLMKMGFIDPQQGLEFLEIGGLNKIYEQIQVSKRQAQRENLRMRVVTEEDIMQHDQAWLEENQAIQQDAEAGLKLDPPLIIPTHTYDEHQIHIEEHNRYRRSQYFESAPAITKMLFEEHVKQHQEALSGMMMHPLTGMEPGSQSDVSEEENVMDGPPDPAGNPTGPDPMPEMTGDSPQVPMGDM